MATQTRPAALKEAAATPVRGTDARVLHVITGMLKGGAEKVATQLSVPRGELAAIAWLKGENDWQDAFNGSNVGLTPLGMEGLHHLPRAVVGLTRLISQFGPDVIHTHLLHGHVVGRWAARRAGG